MYMGVCMREGENEKPRGKEGKRERERERERERGKTHEASMKADSTTKKAGARKKDWKRIARHKSHRWGVGAGRDPGACDVHHTYRLRSLRQRSRR